MDSLLFNIAPIKGVRKRPTHEEDRFQKMCVRWFRYQFPDIIIHHSPNGGYRNAIEGAKFKAMGTLAGFPDLLILAKCGGYGALFVELKTSTGRQSERQKDFEAYCKKNGYAYEVARSTDEFARIAKKYLSL